MARRGQDELLDMLHELAIMQRANAERLARVERCLSLVTAALPALTSDARPPKLDLPAAEPESDEHLSGDEQRFLFEEAAEALELDHEMDVPPRRFLDS